MLLHVFLAVIGLIWIAGMIWGWRFTAGEGASLWARVLYALLWPLTWIASKCIVIPMLRALAVGTLVTLSAAPARADQMVFRNDGWIVRLLHAPCAVSAIESQFNGAGVQKVQATDVDEIGAHTHIRGCWALVPTDNGPRVLAIDEEGGSGLLPTGSFKLERDL